MEMMIFVGYVGPRIDLYSKFNSRAHDALRFVVSLTSEWRVLVMATMDMVIILQRSGLLYFLESFLLMVIITRIKPFEEILTT